MALRRLWRARRLPGETIIGWGPVWPRPTANQAVMHVALGMVPVFGHLLAAGLYGVIGPSRTLLILSDRRVLLLRPGSIGPDPAGMGVRLDEPLEMVEVVVSPRLLASRAQARDGPRPRRARPARPPRGATPPPGTVKVFSFELHTLRDEPMKFYLRATLGEASWRLREGLLTLAESGASGADADSPPRPAAQDLHGPERPEGWIA